VPLDHHLQALTMGTDVRLQDLVDHDALRDMVRSFHVLFGISLRIFSSDGLLLAESVTGQEICHYIGTLENGLRTCMATVSKARTIEPAARGKEVTHPCFTGAQYRIFSIDYDNRKLGKAVLGPFLPTEVTSVPDSPRGGRQIDGPRALGVCCACRAPSRKPSSLICDHLRRTLDLILWSGHKSPPHLANALQRGELPRASAENEKLQEASDRRGSPDRLVELPRRRFARVAHAAHLHHRLQRNAGGGDRGPGRRSTESAGTINAKGQQLLQFHEPSDLSKPESGTMSITVGPVVIGQLLTGRRYPGAQGAQAIVDRMNRRAGLADARGCRSIATGVRQSGRKCRRSPEGGIIHVSAGRRH
jgi:hypothetical protein